MNNNYTKQYNKAIEQGVIDLRTELKFFKWGTEKHIDIYGHADDMRLFLEDVLNGKVNGAGKKVAMKVVEYLYFLKKVR